MLASANVTVATGNSHNPYGRSRCEAIAARLIGEEGLVADRQVLVTTAREMLIEVMSCREGRSSSGVVARVAGGAIGADSFLPNMATEDFTVFDAIIEDYTQELLLFLSALPEKSKYRRMGFTDPIQLFNPSLWGGVTSGKFFAYMKMILSNRFQLSCLQPKQFLRIFRLELITQDYPW